MKAGREHLVPLSERALTILAEQPRSGEFVFEGREVAAPLSNMAMLELMRDMRGKGATVHGLRSSFPRLERQRDALPARAMRACASARCRRCERERLSARQRR